MDDEFHRCVIVVQHQDLVHGWFAGLGFRPHDHARLKIIILRKLGLVGVGLSRWLAGHSGLPDRGRGQMPWDVREYSVRRHDWYDMGRFPPLEKRGMCSDFSQFCLGSAMIAPAFGHAYIKLRYRA